MHNEPLVLERTYNAAIEKVWQALTDHEQLQQWYFDMPEFKAEVGFEFRFTGTSEGQVYQHKCTITQLVPGKKLAYTWLYEGYEGHSEVTFELFDEGNKTRLKLTHTGLETFPTTKKFAREGFATGWAGILDASLKEFVEHKA